MTAQRTRLTLRMTSELEKDLAVLTAAAPDATASDLVRAAVGIVADVYRAAWEAGHTPVNTVPAGLAISYTPTTTGDDH